MKRMCTGKTSRKAAPRSGFKVLGEPDFVLAGSRMRSPDQGCGLGMDLALEVLCLESDLNDEFLRSPFRIRQTIRCAYGR